LPGAMVVKSAAQEVCKVHDRLTRKPVISGERGVT
jgi:hypothetical protein